MSYPPARTIAVALPCLLALSQTIVPSALPAVVAFSSTTPNSLKRSQGFRDSANFHAFPTALHSKKDDAPPPTNENIGVSALSSQAAPRTPNPVIRVMANGMNLLKPAFATEAKIQASLLGFNVDADEVANEIDNEINSNKIVIYTYSLSPFSTEALAMLDGTGYDYTNIELGAEWFLLGGKNSVKRLALSEKVESGATSLPKVFVNGRCIGGCAELAEAVESGAFDVTLKPEGTATQANKFSFFQRIESTKSGIIGLLAGGFALAPFSFVRDVILPPDGVQSRLAQWEYDTDTGSLMGALFAIVYRYCVREDDDNEMLNMGVIGAFVLVRTLSRVAVPSYCTAAPLDCGGPFIGYFDWSIITQVAFNGLESVALFGGAAAAMDWAFDRGLLSKFR